MKASLDALGHKLAETTADSWAPTLLEADYAQLDTFTKSFVEGSEQITFALIKLPDGRTASEWPRDGKSGSADAKSLQTYTAPIRIHGAKSPGTLHLGISFARQERELQGRVVRHFFEYSAALAGIAFAMYWMLERMIGRPLRLLDAQVQRLGTGDLETRISVQRMDELGRLASTLERMRTNLKSSYIELGEQNTRLLALDRMKTEFLANMSHEIRTPMNSIIGCTEFLGDQEISVKERQLYVDILRRNGTHLLTLVNDILDYSKLETGNMMVERHPTDLRSLVQDVVACLEQKIGTKPVRLQATVAATVPTSIDVDPVRLRQVLLNVIDNGIKFTMAGSVTVGIEHRPEAGGQLIIVVSDTGIGISPQALGRLFRPFTQADSSTTRRFGGTGLGLMISRRLAHLLGGEITIASEVGRVSVVTVTLMAPASAEPTALPCSAVLPIPAKSQGSELGSDLGKAPAAAPAKALGRVLVVEDGLDNQRLIRAMLERAGCCVELADNGQVGCDRALAEAAAGTGFDLILMDLQMPVMDGVTATKTLRAAGIAVPIVALTANALPEERERCMAAGCSEFTTKPISRDRLLRVVREHLTRAPSQ